MAVKTPRIGVGTLVAHDVDKDAVTPFFMEATNRRIEDLVVVHWYHALAIADGLFPKL